MSDETNTVLKNFLKNHYYFIYFNNSIEYLTNPKLIVKIFIRLDDMTTIEESLQQTKRKNKEIMDEYISIWGKIREDITNTIQSYFIDKIIFIKIMVFRLLFINNIYNIYEKDHINSIVIDILFMFKIHKSHINSFMFDIITDFYNSNILGFEINADLCDNLDKINIYYIMIRIFINNIKIYPYDIIENVDIYLILENFITLFTQIIQFIKNKLDNEDHKYFKYPINEIFNVLFTSYKSKSYFITMYFGSEEIYIDKEDEYYILHEIPHLIVVEKIILISEEGLGVVHERFNITDFINYIEEFYIGLKDDNDTYYVYYIYTLYNTLFDLYNFRFILSPRGQFISLISSLALAK